MDAGFPSKDMNLVTLSARQFWQTSRVEVKSPRPKFSDPC